MKNPEIELKDIEKIYFLENAKTGEISSSLVLKGVNLSFYKGEIHFILGENGAGKSTLVHILAGLLRASNGCVIIDGKLTSFSCVRDAIDEGVAIILQALPIVDDASVYEQLMLENDGNAFFNIINKKKIKNKYFSLLNEWGVDEFNFERKMKELSKEETFFLELVSRLSKNIKVLILDESSSLIPSHKREAFFNKLKKTAISCNISVIIITHDINEAIERSDRISVISGGVNAISLDSKKEREEIGAKALKEKLKKYITKKDFEIEEREKHGITIDMPHLAPTISIEMKYKGEHFKIEACKGKITGGFFKDSHVFKVFEDCISGFNVAPSVEGGLLIKEAEKFIPFSHLFPSLLLKNKVGVIPSDRYYRGANPNLSIKDVLSIYYIKDALIDEKKRGAWGKAILSEEGIASSLNDACNTISGGQLQRLMLQRCLKEEPKIIILFEPLRGLDIKSMQLLTNKMQCLAKMQKTILVFTQEENSEFLSFISPFYML